jgi:enoyl-CoA hydratase/carnithine racemase
MSDVLIRCEGRAGRITLNRPDALNAMTYEMCREIDAALRAWQTDASVALVILDATGDKAFCAGGDIARLYETGRQGDFGYGRTFWRDEYRMNARLYEYPKPVVSFLQGFTMGGGVGLGCHGSHRVVGDSSQIAMPECGIGLVPDVGGTLMLANAPGRLGEYLGLTAARMGPGDAIHAGFADLYIPEAKWPDLTETLVETGSPASLSEAATSPPASPMADAGDEIDGLFAGTTLQAILATLHASDTDIARTALKGMGRNAPLSLACTVEMLRRLRGPGLTIRGALEMEYRFTWRAMEHGDFLEGIRAQIIDKDRNPRWQHAGQYVPRDAIDRMLAPLDRDALGFDDDKGE